MNEIDTIVHTDYDGDRTYKDIQILVSQEAADKLLAGVLLEACWF